MLGLWLILLAGAFSCTGHAIECSDRKVEQFGDFMEIVVCLGPVHDRGDGGTGVETFQVSYRNTSELEGFLVLFTDPLENLLVTAKVGNDLLPSRAPVFCNPHAPCPYTEHNPRLPAGGTLNLDYRLEDFLPAGGRGEAGHQVRILVSGFIVLDGEDRRRAFRKYAALERRLHNDVIFVFDNVPLFPAQLDEPGDGS